MCNGGRAQTQAFSDLKALPFSVPRLPTKQGHDYVSMWTVRTYMITLMAKEGIPRLTVDPDMWALPFCKMDHMRAHTSFACIGASGPRVWRRFWRCVVVLG